MSDPLADVLRSLRLTGGVFLDVRLTAPWCVISQLTAEDCRPLLTQPAQLIFYHVVLNGEFLLNVEGEAPVSVRGGDIVLLPRNDTHTLASATGLNPIPARSLVQPSADGGLARVVHGGPGALTHMVCGFLGSEQSHTPLLSMLPRVLKLEMREGTSREWIEASVKFAAKELSDGQLPSSSVMARLSEVLLVEAVRQYANGRGDLEAGWLKGLRDPQVGRALAMIHRDLSRPSTATELAREVGMSRSVFVERFTALVGLPPMRYRTACRLQSAQIQLRESQRSIAQIAHSVGYESEEAFSRAFKRAFAHSPSTWREARG
ncbi:AraC-type DNA-binding protein [Filomicrobium insigne]|uniref:AraC-type DNA-binding protein n=1 Tax=Filomicrobium insigne TaxID=418854 RepID=A0A1H0L8X9_9HYPH|nr:AraC family transcriptional regulator [Filomicrobium insigne]SDO64441.1 AraC-type DNA-binding protein [Filomicrobium insigne]